MQPVYGPPQQIEIQRIANGFIVVMPLPRPAPNAEYKEAAKANIEMAKEIFKSMGRDDILEKLQAGGEDSELSDINIGELLNAPSTLSPVKNVYCFKTFPEVIQFLSDTVK